MPNVTLDLHNQTAPRERPQLSSWEEIFPFKPLRGKASKRLIIDLRSPKEFHEGHVAGATNIPLLSNEERHLVGLCYKQEGKNKAMVLGLQFFTKHSRDFLETIKRASQGHSEILLYCARGGLRSRLSAGLLSQVGHKVLLLKGGYKSYRKLVRTTLEQRLPQQPFLVLHGNTGSGKTEILREVENNLEEVQTLDFEALASHSGSAFGDFNQDSKAKNQSQFENDLFQSYLKVCDAPFLLVEIESTLGTIRLSPSLRKALTSSPMLLLKRPIEERLKALAKDYASSWSPKKEELFYQRFLLVKEKFSRDKVQRIFTFLKEKNFHELIRILLVDHYDQRYAKSLQRYQAYVIASFCSTHEKIELINFIKHYIHQKKFVSFPGTSSPNHS